MNYSKKVKTTLLSIIDKMETYHWLFTKNPEKDFSRKKKWRYGKICVINKSNRKLYLHYDIIRDEYRKYVKEYDR